MSVHLPGLPALRGWAAGDGAICVTVREASTGVAVHTGWPCPWSVG